MEPMGTSTETVTKTSPDVRLDAWAALMAAIVERAPKADPGEIQALSTAYRNLT